MCALFADGHLTSNIDALENQDFLHLGRLVALTLLQGGPGLPIFNHHLAEYILTGKVTSLTVEDFPTDRQKMVQEVAIFT
jgi:hypothetical protein